VFQKKTARPLGHPFFHPAPFGRFGGFRKTKPRPVVFMPEPLLTLAWVTAIPLLTSPNPDGGLGRQHAIGAGGALGNQLLTEGDSANHSGACGVQPPLSSPPVAWCWRRRWPASCLSGPGGPLVDPLGAAARVAGACGTTRGPARIATRR